MGCLCTEGSTIEGFTTESSPDIAVEILNLETALSKWSAESERDGHVSARVSSQTPIQGEQTNLGERVGTGRQRERHCPIRVSDRWVRRGCHRVVCGIETDGGTNKWTAIRGGETSD